MTKGSSTYSSGEKNKNISNESVSMRECVRVVRDLILNSTEHVIKITYYNLKVIKLMTFCTMY